MSRVLLFVKRFVTSKTLTASTRLKLSVLLVGCFKMEHAAGGLEDLQMDTMITKWEIRRILEDPPPPPT